MKTLIKLDATALSKSSCLTRLNYFAGEGLTFLEPKCEIEYGVAFHKGMEAYEMATDEDPQMRMFRARTAAIDHWSKTSPRVPPKKAHYCADTLALLIQKYITDVASCDRLVETVIAPDGKPAIEAKFAIPFYSDDDYEVLLCGTIDRIIRVKSSGLMAIWDYKTTSARDPKEYLDNFKLSGQLRIYQYAAMWMGNNYPEGIFGEAMKCGQMGSFIEGVFVRPDPLDVVFQRSECFFASPASLNSFISTLQETILRFLYHHKQGTLSAVRDGILNGSCETMKWGRCDYWGICVNEGNQQAQAMIKQNFFKTKTYDPLKFHD